MAAGCVNGWTANINTELDEGKFNDLKIDSDAKGWITSCATLGAMVMCFPIGIICDMIGRKLANLLLIIPFVVGWLIIILAENNGMIFAGRVITGMAGGAFCISAPMYTSEIAEAEIRGALGSFFQLLLTVGILFAYVVAYLVEPKAYTIICAVLPLLFGAVFFFQPETPVYLMKKGRRDDAKQSLIRLRGQKYNVEKELNEIAAMLQESANIQVNIVESMKKRAAQRSSIICFGLMFFQQLSGINAVIFYTSEIFTSAGSDLDPKIATIIVGAMQIFGTLLASVIVDKLGRKLLLIVSDLFMGISIIVLGLFFTLKERDLVDSSTLTDIGFLPVLSLCVFIIMFSIGYGPIPWMISSEVFPPEIKTFASAAAGTFNWFLAFLVTKFYLDLKEAFGGDVVFYIFGVISLIGTVFVVFFVPETKGKSFDEIQRELNGEKSIVPSKN